MQQIMELPNRTKNINCCTSLETGKNYHKQYWRHCYDCCSNENEGVCLNCAGICHSTHRLGPLKQGNFFCDCNDVTRCKTRNQYQTNDGSAIPTQIIDDCFYPSHSVRGVY